MKKSERRLYMRAWRARQEKVLSSHVLKLRGFYSADEMWRAGKILFGRALKVKIGAGGIGLRRAKINKIKT